MLNKILKEKRIELKMTQQEVADQLNVTRQTVSSWEVGKSIPDISSLIEISELYNISLDYMLKGDKNVTEKLKKDTVELNFLRFFSKSTLIMMGILLMFIFPVSIVFVVVAFLYITIFKKKTIKIITNVGRSNTMRKSSNRLSQALTDSFSVIGGVSLFYIVLSIFTRNDNVIIDERNQLVLIILFMGIAVGRYFQYRKE